MNAEELRNEIDIECEYLETLVQEVASLCADVEEREPTVRERTAAGAFLAQFYGGVENILKRIHRYYNLPLPTGDTWHVDLFKRFCSPGFGKLPVLFNTELATSLAPFRKFRHVMHHGYGFQIEWSMMLMGLLTINDVFMKLKGSLESFVQSIEEK